MTCEQCEENLQAYVDHELSPGEEADMRSHIDHCAQCRGERDGLIRFSRGVHNASIPFQESLEHVNAGILAAEPAGKEGAVVRRPAGMFGFGRRGIFTWGGLVSAALIIGIFLVLRPHGPEPDRLIDWAIQHYPLVDQVHGVRGDAVVVQEWFKEHHGIVLRPPAKADYAELSGCKMTEFGSQPVPLLRFDGKKKSAVFVLPADFSIPGDIRTIGTFARKGFRVEVWMEGSNSYVRVMQFL